MIFTGHVRAGVPPVARRRRRGRRSLTQAFSPLDRDPHQSRAVTWTEYNCLTSLTELTPFSRILSSFVSILSLIGDSVRRLRYRRADLQRLTAIEAISNSSSRCEAIHWILPLRMGGR